MITYDSVAFDDLTDFSGLFFGTIQECYVIVFIMGYNSNQSVNLNLSDKINISSFQKKRLYFSIINKQMVYIIPQQQF